MKNSTPALYLSASEAAAELGISTATLYAYVSRGLIRSEPGEQARSRRYRAADVRSLKSRNTSGADKSAETDAPVFESAVSTITENGPLYRGVYAVALAQSATLEQTATLLWDAQASDPFAAANMPPASAPMRQVLRATQHAPPLDRAIATLALATEADPRAFNSTAESRAMTGARILRLIVATIIGAEPAAAPLHQQIARALAPRHGSAADLIRRALVLLADHELNASTFTVRCAASTGISLYDAAIAGLVALKGPRHGGAGPLAARFVDSLEHGDPAALVRERVAMGDAIPGFGHVIYRDGDPRAMTLLDALKKAGADKRLTTNVPALVADATGSFVNIDYALAVLCRTLALPKGSETAIFAMARSAGWIAHAIEQLGSARLIRPRARYVGPAPGRASARHLPLGMRKSIT